MFQAQSSSRWNGILYVSAQPDTLVTCGRADRRSHPARRAGTDEYTPRTELERDPVRRRLLIKAQLGRACPP